MNEIDERLKKIADKVGIEEVACQLAEECNELAQAALKYRRVLHGTTPVSDEEALAKLAAEIADVKNCINAMAYLLGCKGNFYRSAIGIMQEAKVDRWYVRTFGENYGEELE